MGAVKMQIEIARMMITLVRGRAERARRQGRSDLGASAIEWAIISGIVVTLALVVYEVVKRVVESRETEIQDGVD